MESQKQFMESLWAPWRVEYFDNEHRPTGNFFEEAASSQDDRANLVIQRGKNVFLIMNKYPYAPGHLMVAPYRQVAKMEDLSDSESSELWNFCVLAQKLLRKAINPHGFNVGVNLGSAAGAGYAHHLHFHIVPRWDGDSNFMATIGNTRILPNALSPMYEKLSSCLDSLT